MGAKLGGGGRRQRRAHGVMSEINVTPFVDVMLVLLVIFMITAPLLSAGLTVELPKADASALAQQDSSPIEVTLDKQGNIYVGENKVTQDRLVTMLQAISDETKDRKVYLKADQRLDYGKVFEMMALTRKMGFTVALVSEPSTSRK